MRRLAILVLVVGLPLLFIIAPATAAAAGMTYSQAVDKLVADGYPQSIVNHLSSLGTSPLGFRFAGSSSDNEAARWIADEMRAAGLKKVRLERVPVDVWDFKGASVTFGGQTYTASTFGGVPPTPPQGLSGEVVYVGDGTAADFATAGDMTKKIALVDLDLANWWMNWPGGEAALAGAKAVILTFSTDKSYYDQPNALGSFDGNYSMNYAPMVYVPKTVGDALKAALQGGSVEATVRNDVRVRLHDQGGRGYNVLGVLPGKSGMGRLIVVASHHDAYFSGALDNASAVATNLLMAKAMKMSGHKPRAAIVFLSTTGEEFAYTDAYYDWCIGAWWAITHAHKSWPGRVIGMLNSEIQGYKNGNMWMLSTPELKPLVEKTMADHPELLGINSDKASVTSPVWSWNDQWTFTAAGVPSISFWSQDDAYAGYYKQSIYHTQYDVPALINYDFLGTQNKFQFEIAKELDTRGVIPLDLKARADELAATIDKDALLGLDVPAGTVARLEKALASFTKAADAFNARKADIGAPAGGVNTRLLRIDRALNRGLTALDWLDNTVYPHQQVQHDLEQLDAAVAALEAEPVQEQAARDALSGVDYTVYGVYFSHDVYTQELTHHQPDYDLVTWGGQGHLAPAFDLMPVYDKIGVDNAAALTEVKTARDAELAELNARLAKMARLFRQLTPLVRSLR
jgi:Iap family predicted aminopeptidase